MRLRVRWDDAMGFYRVNVPGFDPNGEGVDVITLDVEDDMVERAALAAAKEFGFEWVFESDATDENYNAAYWRHVARHALAAALAPASTGEGQHG